MSASENKSASPFRILPEQVICTIADVYYYDTVSPDWVIDNRLFADYDIFICTEGEALFIINGKEYQMSRGKAFLMRKGLTLTAQHTKKRHFRTFAQHFEAKLFGVIDIFSLLRCPTLVTLTNPDATIRTVDEYTALKKNAAEPFRQHGLFLTMLSDYLRDGNALPAEQADENGFINEMVQQINSGAADETALAKALARSPYGPRYTAALFKKVVGLTPKKFLLHSRIRIAKDMLYRGASVKEAAHTAGYDDELYFSRLFKRYEGLSPEHYRQF
ncbi:MAG: helix-turn-helix domain-containing protein [Spirochaetes bacterium]|nr:helix-turn-helix domain-containing protein [Spirochaetota bacterium]